MAVKIPFGATLGAYTHLGYQPPRTDLLPPEVSGAPAVEFIQRVHNRVVARCPSAATLQAPPPQVVTCSDHWEGIWAVGDWRIILSVNFGVEVEGLTLMNRATGAVVERDDYAEASVDEAAGYVVEALANLTRRVYGD